MKGMCDYDLVRSVIVCGTCGAGIIETEYVQLNAAWSLHVEWHALHNETGVTGL